MNLRTVTITGADESADPEQLVDLSIRYPFVEWGILVSNNRMAARFPSQEWREQLQNACKGTSVALSLHLCGRWLRKLMLGNNEMPPGIIEGFGRAQLNFHGEKLVYNSKDFSRALSKLGLKEYIFQIDGNRGRSVLEEISAETESHRDFKCSALFDTSHGAGVLPKVWPIPDYTLHFACNWYGYAGGLGPENLQPEIQRIANAAGDAPFWIDMETQVRSNNDQLFDIDKVERCLKLAKPFIMREN